MVTLFILVFGSLLLRGIGWLGVTWLSSWRTAVRVALAIMFLFTGLTHFSDMRHDFVEMIPAPLPKELWLVYVTGALEIAGALGLLIPRLRRPAAIGLVLLLIAMFPANVHASLNGIPLRGEPPTSLWLRLPMQLLFMGAVWWTSLRTPLHATSQANAPQPA